MKFDFPAPFREFDSRLERHIHWEEGISFPAVCGKAPHLEMGPIQIMKMEHDEIRKAKAVALKVLCYQDGTLAKSHAEAMVHVLKEYNATEEQILYPACDQLLGPGEVKQILDWVRSFPDSPSKPISR